MTVRPPATAGSETAATPVPVRRGASVGGSARPGVQRAPETVPGNVRSELEPVLGESLAGVKVHRGPETGEAAQAIQAKAFTTGGEVYLPDWHGSASSGEGRKILSHELTHVVQQRSLGSQLPAEDSPTGRALEAEARSVGGQSPAAGAPVVARPVAARGGSAPQRLAGHAPPIPARAVPTAGSPGAGATRLPDGHTTSTDDQAAIAEQVRAAAVQAGIPASVGASPLPIARHESRRSTHHPSVATPTPVAVQRLGESTPAASPSSTASTQSSSNGQSPTPPTTTSAPAPAATPTDLDDLARRLYPRFRTRLRHDLLADRERSGRLFDGR